MLRSVLTYNLLLFKLLAFLLKMKSSLVSNRTFQLVLYLSGSVELNSGSGFLQNIPAFQTLLCDLEVRIHILAHVANGSCLCPPNIYLKSF